MDASKIAGMEPRLDTPSGFLRRWNVILPAGLLVYFIFVRSLRYQRAKRLQKQYAPAGRESFRFMTTEDAQAILKELAELEFPKLYGLSMVVALFRVGRLRKSVSYPLISNVRP